MPQGAATERDALDRWFDRCTRSWWRRWRWPVWAIWGLMLGTLGAGIFVMSNSGNFSMFGANTYRGYYYQPTPAAFSWYARLIYLVWGANTYVGIVAMVVHWIGATQAVRCLAMPPEVAITSSSRDIYQRSLRRARQNFYRMTSLPVLILLPIVLLTMGTASLYYSADDSISRLLVSCGFGAGVLLFTAEWHIALLMRFPPRLGLNYLYWLPLVHIPVNYYFGTMVEYAPPGAEEVYNTIGYTATVLSAAGLIGGMAIGAYLWRYLLFQTTRLGHLLMAGLLAGISLLRVAIDEVQGGAQAFSWLYVMLLHGAALGNCSAGWVSGGLFNMEQFQWHLANPGSMRFHDPPPELGMYVLPELWLPLWGVLLWLAIYYGFSVWAIRSAANVMPKGYTGTWQE